MDLQQRAKKAYEISIKKNIIRSSKRNDAFLRIMRREFANCVKKIIGHKNFTIQGSGENLFIEIENFRFEMDKSFDFFYKNNHQTTFVTAILAVSCNLCSRYTHYKVSDAATLGAVLEEEDFPRCNYPIVIAGATCAREQKKAG